MFQKLLTVVHAGGRDREFAGAGQKKEGIVAEEARIPVFQSTAGKEIY